MSYEASIFSINSGLHPDSVNFVFCVFLHIINLVCPFSPLQPVYWQLVLAGPISKPSEGVSDITSQAIPWQCLSGPWGFDFVFCGICWFLFSEFLCLQHEKCCLNLVAIKAPGTCGFMLFLLTSEAFSAILWLSQNEMQTHSSPLHLALGTSPRLLSSSL